MKKVILSLSIISLFLVAGCFGPPSIETDEGTIDFSSEGIKIKTEEGTLDLSAEGMKIDGVDEDGNKAEANIEFSEDGIKIRGTGENEDGPGELNIDVTKEGITIDEDGKEMNIKVNGKVE